jgi:hypothetical protein
MANLFVLSLIAIKSSDKHRCFTQRAEHKTLEHSCLENDHTLVVRIFVKMTPAVFLVTDTAKIHVPVPNAIKLFTD